MNSEELSKSYNPKEVEDKIYQLWEESGYFNPNNLVTGQMPARRSSTSEGGSTVKGSHKKPPVFCVMMAPPNITGSLHMGHALENTMSDVLVRWKRMQGYKTLWLPGIDHAGIAAQNVVEKELRKEGLSRHDLGKEKFVAKIWEWKEKYGHIILDQLKKLGVSADWSRTRFTLDKDYATAVLQSFKHYQDKGWVYRALRTINWCVRCQTSISDLEVAYKEEDAKLYYIKYGLFTLATVRPETKFGDTALAVNPKDERYQKYVGQEIEIESLDTSGSLDQPAKTKIKIKVVTDEAVDPNFGTGVIKVTPAHDITDYEISQRHNLPLAQVIDERGRMNENAGKYAGLKTKEAREKIVSDLQAIGLLIKEEPHHHNIAVCERCGTAIEPLPSQQWFLKMKDLAKLAKQAIKSGKVKIKPENFQVNALVWLDNVRDWCISRQLWWGHQLPVYFCENKQEEFLISNFQFLIKEKGFVINTEKPKQCPFCKTCQMKRSPDVLDTWFSSALWPFATLGWPIACAQNQKSKIKNQNYCEPTSGSDLEKYYPTNFITSAREILNLWILRMIFSGMEFMQEVPFENVLIHSTILTKDRKRMSKSLGTGIDPLLLIEKYGADATRFAVIWQAMGTQDIRWDEAAVVAGKKFANKIWNASRFVFGQIGNSKFEIRNSKQIQNTQIVKQLNETKKIVEENLENYQFGHALHQIYEFFWHQYCDIYLEEAKSTFAKASVDEEKSETAATLLYVLVESLKLLHPFMPFITEEVYQKLPLENRTLLMVENWHSE